MQHIKEAIEAKKTKFTPGPWRALTNKEHKVIKRPGIDAPDAKQSIVLVATTSLKYDGGIFGETDEEANANALLIADAPSMWELLRELVSYNDKANIADMHHASFPCQQSEKLQSIFTRAATLVSRHLHPTF